VDIYTKVSSNNWVKDKLYETKYQVLNKEKGIVLLAENGNRMKQKAVKKADFNHSYYIPEEEIDDKSTHLKEIVEALK
jgi:hypothetical protein